MIIYVIHSHVRTIKSISLASVEVRQTTAPAKKKTKEKPTHTDEKRGVWHASA